MADRPVIVLGAGGHAKVVVDLLQKLGRTVVAVVEVSRSIEGPVLGVPVEDESIVLNHATDGIDLALGVGMPTQDPIKALGDRLILAKRFQERDYRFPALVHPSAEIGGECVLGDGVQVMARAVVQPGCTVGAFAIINPRAGVDHDCVLGAGCHLGPSVTLGGVVKVGDETLVGIGATVRQGITIGSRALIAGGAMVVDDARDGEVRSGVPARRRAQ